MHTLRSTFFALVFLALSALTAHAQPPVFAGYSLYFDHDGVNVDRWEYHIDTGDWLAAAPTKGSVLEGGMFSWSIPFPAATPGPHTIAVRACNIGGCAESDPFAFVLVAIPAKPINLRIGTAAP